MSGTTTSGGDAAAARTLDLNRLRQDLRARPGKARGRDAAQELVTVLSRLRRDRRVAPVLLALENGGTMPFTPLVEAMLTDLGVDPAALAAATTAEAPPAPPPPPAGSTTGTAATGALSLAADTGTGTVTIPGQALAANAPGYWADVSLFSRGADGVRVAATARVIVGREAGDAFAAVAVTNHFGGVFGAAGTAGISVAVAVACAADGSTATLTLTNSGTAARSVAYAVQRRAAG